MGSTQSTPSSPPTEAPPTAPTQTTPSTQPPTESGYALAKRKCLKKQRLYDACYTAALSSKDEDCGELFEAYRTCFLKWMSRDMVRRGVRVSGGSMVGEFLEEESEDR
jgi:hypothetical protein